MQRDQVRVQRVTRAMREHRLQALVCAAPENVLMLTGYWPVTGTSVVVVEESGRITILAPSDEEDLAGQGWADGIKSFQAASLEDLRSTADGMTVALNELLSTIHGTTLRIGYERDSTIRPASYVAQQVYGESVRQAHPDAEWVGADEMLWNLKGALTPTEIDRVRVSTEVAQLAFRKVINLLRPGVSEPEIASLFHLGLLPVHLSLDAHRALGFTYCMSGPNAYHAFAAYLRSRDRKLECGDLVLLHCNSCVDGFWTDITRTFVLGEPDTKQRRMFHAIFEARAAALQCIRPGVVASEIDAAARGALVRHGFGEEFRHSTGHGVGFAAIDHNALPRIHPKSSDVLEAGMVLNIEPGIYIEGCGGMRHCDMIAVTPDGYELLTPFNSAPQSLHLP